MDMEREANTYRRTSLAVTVTTVFLLGAAIELSACRSDVGAEGLAIIDPLGLIDDVQGPLRLLVLPAQGRACDPTTGLLTPALPDSAPGELSEAVVDVELAVVGGAADTRLEIPPGAYSVHLRGRGVDPVTGENDALIAAGCQEVSIGSGATREVRVTLLPVVAEGLCGDGRLTPDESCDDGGTTGGDGCDARCQTEAFVVNTTLDGEQNNVRVSGAPDSRWIFSYDSQNVRILIRMLEADGSTIDSPSILSVENPLDGLTALRLLADNVSALDGTIALAYTDFSGGGQQIRVSLFNQDRSLLSSLSVSDNSGNRGPARVAFTDDRHLAVVFTDSASSTGAYLQMLDPSGVLVDGGPFEIGPADGAIGAVQVAGRGDNLALTYSAGGEVFAERFDSNGEPTQESTMLSESDGSVNDSPAVAVDTLGAALVVWRNVNTDSGRSRILGRWMLGAEIGPQFVVNTADVQPLAPQVVATDAGFVVIFEAEGTIRARVYGPDGMPSSNRQNPPTTSDFEVSPMGAAPALAFGGPGPSPMWLAVWQNGTDVHGRFFPVSN